MKTIFIDLMGYIAATLTTISFIPQLVKIIKTKSVNDISYEMFVIFLAGITFWFIYGILIKAPPIIIANFITMLINITIIFFKFKYEKI